MHAAPLRGGGAPPLPPLAHNPGAPPRRAPQVRETSRWSLFGRGPSTPAPKTNEAVAKNFSDIILPAGLHNQVGGGLGRLPARSNPELASL
jgi:hypothetical protein